MDLNRNYLDWGRRNFKLNGLDADAHDWIRADTIDFIEQHPEERVYDQVIVDPPTFSNSKSTERDWEVQRDHVWLLNKIAQLVTPGGVIYFSNNYRRFKLEEDALQGMAVRDISKQTVPEDFANKRTHRCWRLRVE